MKKIIILLVFYSLVAGLIFISSDMAFAKRKDKREEAKKSVQETPKEILPQETSPQAPETKSVYTFKSKEEMAEFERLYVSKQATFGRMGVLQAYFAMEQNNLKEIDKEMEEKFGFKMDPGKVYDLDRENMEIKEAGPLPQAAPAK